MFGLFNKSTTTPLQVDLHSHLIPGIDDGCKTVEDSIEILKSLKEAGINKVITTPHIAQEFYPNTPEIIKEGLADVRKALESSGIDIQLEAAAEYYMDEHFLQMLRNDEPLLTFGDNLLLFETPFYNKPPFFDEVIFELVARGFIPVFAHPERYQYCNENREFLLKLKERNVRLQVNAGSLIGYYSGSIKKMAQWMMKNQLIDYLGSDIHNRKHLNAFIKFRDSKDYQKLLKLKILNDHLLT